MTDEKRPISSIRKPTILIVEDSMIEQLDFAEVLKDFIVLRALTSQEARALFKSHRSSIEVIILDGYLSTEDREVTTLELIKDFRREGFKGPMFAVSSDGAMRRKQEVAGCSHVANKHQKRLLSQRIKEVLDMD